MTGQPYRCDRCHQIHNDDSLMPECVAQELSAAMSKAKPVVLDTFSKLLERAAVDPWK